MRRHLGLCAVALGASGALLCAAAIGLSWLAAVKGADRVNRVSVRLADALAATDTRLSRVEERLAAVRGTIGEIRGAAEQFSVENPKLPRVRAALEQLLDRLIVVTDRAAELADSLRTVAVGLRAAEDVVVRLGGEDAAPGRGRAAADAIDRAAEVLDLPRTKIEAAKSAQAARLIHIVVTLAHEAAAGSERLAEGLAEARREVAAASRWTVECRDRLVFWVYLAAAAGTLMALWVGLGQFCLIGWGRRQFARPSSANP